MKQETKQKISNKMKQMWENPTWNELDRRRKISFKAKGRMRTIEHCQKISNSKKGKPPWNKNITGYSTLLKGIPKSEEHKKKIKETMLKRGISKMDKNPNWRGGKSFELYPFEFTNELKTKIRKRDKFQCQTCFKNGYCVHHIDENKQNCKVENLITLCKHCHALITNISRWKQIKQGYEL